MNFMIFLSVPHYLIYERRRNGGGDEAVFYIIIKYQNHLKNACD